MMAGDVVNRKARALIVFVRHPELGKVKTRLARSIGDEKALAVYQKLLRHTLEIVLPVDCDKFIYYTDGIVSRDMWDDTIFQKRSQHGFNLGERMQNAFKELFQFGYDQVMIIGSDCYQLTKAEVSKAFTVLDSNNVVIGPTFDGGYYLLGMTTLFPSLFQDKLWSTAIVAEQTLKDIAELKLSYQLLQKLHDVDEAKDLILNGITV